MARFGNRIHTVTREDVIRTELLFKEGDKYDPLIISESERELRANDYLTDEWIKVVPNHESKTVDIIVHTRDQWSLIVGGTFGGTDENIKSGLDFGEKNLLGYGQTLNYRFRSSNAGAAHAVGFKDSTFASTRYLLDLGYDFTDSKDIYNLILEKPFYSLSTKSAHGAKVFYSDDNDANEKKKLKRSRVYYGWSNNFWGENILRTTAVLSVGELDYLKKGKPHLVSRDNKILFKFDFLFEPHRYVKDTYIERFRIVEDIPLGLGLTLTAGKQLKSLGATSSDFSGGVSLRKNFKSRKRDYLKLKLDLWQNDENFNYGSYGGSVRYFFRDFKYQTFVFNAEVSYLDSKINKKIIGGTEGLRGFKSGEFEGKGRVAINIEDRIFTYKSAILGIFEPGFVVFTDWGNTWGDYRGDDLTKLHGSVGCGLRVALIKAPGINLIRADVGYPVTRQSSAVVTVGMEGFF